MLDKTTQEEEKIPRISKRDTYMLPHCLEIHTNTKVNSQKMYTE